MCPARCGLDVNERSPPRSGITPTLGAIAEQTLESLRSSIPYRGQLDVECVG